MIPPTIPDHNLLRPIGRGAYGEVWLARNVMGTLRAIKVIRRGDFRADRPYEREFAGIQNYEPVSRTSGGLVHVLHVGRNDSDGYFYYVMELADPEGPGESGKPNGTTGISAKTRPLEAGSHTADISYAPRTLRSDLERLGRLPASDCLSLAMEVVNGLAQLHRLGLVHRDVKPGNIIYVHGRAKLADIGLVSARGEGRTFVGTEGYIPPEGPGTPGADLYALGIVLYEAVTGFSPERFPEVPAEWFSDSAGDDALELHEVILKACESQRERRYQSAEQMHADLALLQSGQSLRQMRALQRRYALLKLSGLVGTSLLVCALSAVWFTHYRARMEMENRTRETRLREDAQRSLMRAEEAERDARNQLSAELLEQARALVLSKELGHRTRALDALRRATAATNIAELRRVAFAALGIPDLRPLHDIPLRPEQTLAQVDPEFERIAVGHGPDPVRICSLPDLKPEATLSASTNNSAHVARWSPDGRFLAVKRQYDYAGTRSDLEVWAIGVAPRIITVFHDVAYGAFCFHPQRPELMLAQTGAPAAVWDLEVGRELRTVSLGPEVHALSYSPDGNRFAASYRKDGSWVVGVHNAASGVTLRAIQCPEPSEQIMWHPRGQWIGICGDNATEWNRAVRMLATDTGTMTVLGRHRLMTAMLEFTPDGRYLMSAGWDHELVCWDLETHQRVFSFAGAGHSQTWRNHASECALIIATPPAERLGFYAFDRPACRELDGQIRPSLRAGAMSPDSHWLAITDEQELWIWDLAGNPQPRRLPLEGETELFFSGDSTKLFALTGPMEQARLRVWCVSPNPLTNGPPELSPIAVRVPPRLSGAALTANELVLTSAEGVRLVPTAALEAGQGRVVGIPSGKGIVSPDGRWLAVLYPFSRFTTIYKLPSVEKVARVETEHFIANVSFTPSGDEMIVINRAGIEWWDTANWRVGRREPGVPIAGSWIFTPSGGVDIWKMTNPREAGLYDRHTLQPRLLLPSNIMPVAFSADGRTVAVNVDDQRVQVWSMGELRSHLRELGLDW